MTKSILLCLSLLTLGLSPAYSQALDKESATTVKETVEPKEKIEEPGVEITLSQPTDQATEDPKKSEPTTEDGGSKQWVVISICIVLYVSLRIMIRRKS